MLDKKFAISKKEFAALQDHSILGPTVRKDQVVQWRNEPLSTGLVAYM